MSFGVVASFWRWINRNVDFAPHYSQTSTCGARFKAGFAQEPPAN